MSTRRMMLPVVLLLAATATAAEETVDDAVKRLLEAARLSDAKAVTAAAQDVVGFGDAAREPLLDGLVDREEPEIVWSLRCLRHVGAPESETVLVTLCRDERPSIRAEAVIVTSRSLGAAGLPILLEAARDEDKVVRCRALDGLLQVAAGRRETIAPAVAGLLDKDFWIKSRAVRLLARVPRPSGDGADPIADAVIPSVGRLDKKAATRLFALLAKRRTKEVPLVIAAAIENGSPWARAAALDAAATLRLRVVAESARAIVQKAGGRAQVVKAAMRLLSTLRDEASVPALVDRLEEGDARFREDAAVALRQITGQVFGFDVAKWRRYIAEQGL